MTDATDRSRRDATHHHLCILAADLNQDELEVALDVVDGLLKGRAVYGPLDIATEQRDLLAEAQDELRDFVVYRSIAKLQRQRRERAALVEAAGVELGAPTWACPGCIKAAGNAELSCAVHVSNARAIDTWGKVIVRSPEARPPATTPLECSCAGCLSWRANAAALAYAIAPVVEHVEPERSIAIGAPVANTEES